MPDRIKVDGVEFVEFAADETEAAELGTILRTLGFERSGRHVSKDVDLWSQGRCSAPGRLAPNLLSSRLGRAS